jgi:signal recognition particle GTPase
MTRGRLRSCRVVPDTAGRNQTNGKLLEALMRIHTCALYLHLQIHVYVPWA